MKAIHSPYNDDDFNEYLLSYTKARLRRRALCFNDKYKIEVPKSDVKFNSKSIVYTYDASEGTSNVIEITPDNIINTLVRKNNIIHYTNLNLIKHFVYDLNQKFWYDELAIVNNLVRKLYHEYTGLL